MNDLLKALALQWTVHPTPTDTPCLQFKVDEKKLIEATARLCIQSMQWVADINKVSDETRSTLHAAEMRICKLCEIPLLNDKIS